MAKHDNSAAIRAVLLRRERATGLYARAEQPEIGSGNMDRLHLIRLANASDVDSRATEIVCGDVRKRVCSLSQDVDFWDRERHTPAVRRSKPQLDDSVRLRIWQRVKQYCVDQGEYGRVRANAKR